jgi:hypothetical protein
MHRRLVKSFATMIGASVLLVVPVVLAAPAHAGVVAAEQPFLEPDDVVPFSIEANEDEFWEAYVDLPNIVCLKDESPGDSPYVVPDLRLIIAVILYDGSESETANEVYLRPPEGGLIEHEGLAHVFVCQPEQQPIFTSTPPVVETDRVGDTGATYAALALSAGAVTAGACALFLSRRRPGAHR